MNRFLLLPLILLSLFSFNSCKKDNNGVPPDNGDNNNHDDPSNAYFIKFKIDGQPVEDKTVVGIVYKLKTDKGDSIYSVQVAFVRKWGNQEQDSNSIHIILSAPSMYSPGTIYGVQASSIPNAVKLDVFAMLYYDRSNRKYAPSIFNNIEPPPFDAHIIFTEITEKKLKGTFSGTLHFKDSSGVTTKTVVITDGEFFAGQ
jgi:hypothetical protein